MKFYWDPKEQPTKRHPVNIRYPKNLAQHIGGVWSSYNRDKTYVPVFYSVIKLWVLILVCVISASTLVI